MEQILFWSIFFNIVQLLIILSLMNRVSILQSKLMDLKSAFLKVFPPPKPKPVVNPKKPMKWRLKDQ